MIRSAGSILRAGLLLLLAVVLELSAFSQITVAGGHADLVVLAVAVAACCAGSIPGSAAGFAAGFVLDALSGAPMGVSSLVLTAVGYGVGRFRELGDPIHGVMAIPVGAAATAGWVVALGAVAFMLDIGAPVSPLVLRDMVVTVLLNALLALPVFAGARMLLRPPLAIGPLGVRRRRRRRPRDIGRLGLRGLEA